MRAAVVSTFDQAPTYGDLPTPVPSGPHEDLVDVLAAGLHPRVRSQADGSHYSSTDQLPLVPGIDGVGRSSDGVLRYFILPDTTIGSMAAQTVVDLRRSIELPEGTDPVAVAAAMNPAMSSWIALRRRVPLRPGQRVLVMGATGNAGRVAVQVAKHLGASYVAAAGRHLDRVADQLTTSGADVLVELTGDPHEVEAALGRAGRDVDVVIDYLWGQPTADALRAMIPARVDDSQVLSWIQVGSVAGLESAIPSAALRAARLQIVGSGQGSVPTGEILGELPSLVAQVSAGTFDIRARAVPLAEVEQAWADAPTSPERLVLVP